MLISCCQRPLGSAVAWQAVFAAVSCREFSTAAPLASLPPTPGPLGYRFAQGKLVAVTEVGEGDKFLGTLFVRSDMRVIYERLALYALVAMIIIALALLLAWVISRRLQRELSEPILALAATAEVVSTRRDYSVRAVPPGINELDTLVRVQITCSRRPIISKPAQHAGQLAYLLHEIRTASAPGTTVEHFPVGVAASRSTAISLPRRMHGLRRSR